MLNGSWLATAPAPSVMPERLRNVRRSTVRPSMLDTGRVRRLCASGPDAPVDLRVSSIEASSDLGGTVVVADVFGELIALARLGVARFRGRAGRFFFGDDCRGARCTARAD